MSAERDLRRVQDAVEALGLLIGRRKPAATRAALAGVDLARSGQRVLDFVVARGPIRISDLAQQVGMADAVASRQISALEADGFVERIASAEDGRVSLIRPTAKGRRAGERLRRAADEIFQKRMKNWSDSDLHALCEQLDRLVVDLGGTPSSPR